MTLPILARCTRIRTLVAAMRQQCRRSCLAVMRTRGGEGVSSTRVSSAQRIGC